MIISAGQVLAPDGPLGPGYLRLDGSRIVEVAAGPAPEPVDWAFPESTVAPGYVDVHCHGGGGASFDGDDADIAVARETHLARGTTSLVASLVTADLATLTAQVERLAGRVEAGELAGIHLEGPWLRPRFAGAHAPELLRDPRLPEVESLLAAGRGTIRMVTIAPELPGALPAIAAITAANAVAAIGHTGCSETICREALAVGARGATHLFNAMPPLHHRDPGPVLALLDDPRVTLELIADGRHVHLDLVRHVMRCAPERVALITDAMAAAGAADGCYRLGGHEVEVRDGVAHLLGTQVLAGSTLTLDDAVQTVVAAGVPLAQAVRAATAVPADYLGLSAGRLVPGAPANLVLLDERARVIKVMAAGHWLGGS